MGIIRTEQWLHEDFGRPDKICERLTPYFKGQKPNEIYSQLMNFGMYTPSRASKINFDFMLREKVWDKAELLFQKYRDNWSGPDVPVFLFPLCQAKGFFLRKEEKRKGGVSFPDKMFLFLGQIEDPKELEALFVHEYHHVCRLQTLNKRMEDYTLLDSIIIEGLAEYAVLKHCGKEYLANWCHMYTDREISDFWDKYLKDMLQKKKNERVHDQLLFGGGRIPKLLGYAAGYNIIGKFYKKRHYSAKLSFSLPAEKYIDQ